MVFHDNLLLEPENVDLFELGYFEGVTNYNNLVIISSDIDTNFIEAMRKYLAELEFNSEFGISKLDCAGLAVKILGPTAGDNHTVLMACLNYFRVTLKHLPKLNLRKNDRRD